MDLQVETALEIFRTTSFEAFAACFELECISTAAVESDTISRRYLFSSSLMGDQVIPVVISAVLGPDDDTLTVHHAGREWPLESWLQIQKSIQINLAAACSKTTLQEPTLIGYTKRNNYPVYSTKRVHKKDYTYSDCEYGPPYTVHTDDAGTQAGLSCDELDEADHLYQECLRRQRNQMANDRAQAYNTQWSWWKANGKMFPLFSLPPELRDNIYTHAWGERTAPYLCGITPRPLRRNHAIFEEFSVATEVETPNTSVARLGKQVNDEYKQAAIEQTIKVLYTPAELARLLSWSWTQPSAKAALALRRLELNFEHDAYIRFFNVHLPGIHVSHEVNWMGPPTVTPLPRDASWGAARVLKHIPNLRVLTIRFQSTMLGPLTDPWRSWPQDLQFRELPATSCQKVLLDWMLKFGYEYLKGVNAKVYLTGAIKSSAKKKWEQAIRYHQSTGDDLEVELVEPIPTTTDLV
ncbi:hypothetical protein LTS18_000117 [Coniosporium uncinatum]|uniref:Uncharacterized protein n=1 Tax=Coniosporium uncinatum TaxID=93489 RepID=A0ACC3DUZ1_9PEZI|nr:hypothetical protein LTS18_000117 [Coniosporium uncinatum]